MNKELRGVFLATLLLLASFGGTLAMTGAVAAAGNGTELANETVTVTNDTRSVYANVEGDTNGTLDVEFYSVADNGTETLVDNGTATVTTSDGEVVVETTNVDPANHSNYRVLVLADEGETASTITIGTTQYVAGGGGGISIGGQSYSFEMLLGGLAILGFLGAAYIYG